MHPCHDAAVLLVLSTSTGNSFALLSPSSYHLSALLPPILAASAMSTGDLVRPWDTSETGPGGTGNRFARAVIIVAGVSAVVASLITFV